MSIEGGWISLIVLGGGVAQTGEFVIGGQMLDRMVDRGATGSGNRQG
jgi:hypothetical protein